MSGRVIKVEDSLQQYSYELVAEEGKDFDPQFKPELTPAEMLELGVFGAHYFEGEHSEFPAAW